MTVGFWIFAFIFLGTVAGIGLWSVIKGNK